MKLSAGDWLEIFRAGDYGPKGKYSTEDLEKMVANFNAADQAPIVVGHPETDAPAWGWLSEVKRQGEVLLGRIGELHKDFAAALAENKFRNRSVRIAQTASGPKLLHLGFLGAVLPQVEGLKTAAFGDDSQRLDYAFDLPEKAPTSEGGQTATKEEEMDKDEQIKKLQADLAAEKKARADEKTAADEKARKTLRAEFALFVDSELIGKGKLPKEEKEAAVEFMASLPTGEAADFSVTEEGKTTTHSLVEWFKDFVKSLPAADFTRELPPGAVKDFGQGQGKTKVVDLSHKA